MLIEVGADGDVIAALAPLTRNMICSAFSSPRVWRPDRGDFIASPYPWLPVSNAVEGTIIAAVAFIRKAPQLLCHPGNDSVARRLWRIAFRKRLLRRSARLAVATRRFSTFFAASPPLKGQRRGGARSLCPGNSVRALDDTFCLSCL